MKYQAVNIAYVIFHRTGKFGLVIRECNCMTKVQRTWVSSKQFFRIAHRELRETSDLTVEDNGMHHANMVRDVVSGLHETLQKEQAPTENAINIPKPIDHVSNASKSTQQHLATQLQKMQAMIQAMHIQYAAAPQNAHQYYGGNGYHGGYTNYSGRGGRSAQLRGNLHGGKSGRCNSDLTHYCWTHVMCAYLIKYCRTPSEGHKKDVVCCNKMLGSKRNCT